jgi:hypothetical protein
MSAPAEITLTETSPESGANLPVPEPAVRADGIEPFQFLFYKTLDTMRIEWGMMIGMKYDYDHTKKPEEKKVVGQLMMLRANDYKAKLATFFDEVDEFLTNLE